MMTRWKENQMLRPENVTIQGFVFDREIAEFVQRAIDRTQGTGFTQDIYPDTGGCIEVNNGLILTVKLGVYWGQNKTMDKNAQGCDDDEEEDEEEDCSKIYKYYVADLSEEASYNQFFAGEHVAQGRLIGQSNSFSKARAIADEFMEEHKNEAHVDSDDSFCCWLSGDSVRIYKHKKESLSCVSTLQYECDHC